MDQNKNIYYSGNFGRETIQIYSTTIAQVNTLITNTYMPVYGPANGNSISGPQGLVFDESTNTVILTDSAVVRRVDRNGFSYPIAGSAPGGSCVDGFGTSAQFSNPTAVALDSNFNILVADRATIRRINSSSMYWSKKNHYFPAILFIHN